MDLMGKTPPLSARVLQPVFVGEREGGIGAGYHRTMRSTRKGYVGDAINLLIATVVYISLSLVEDGGIRPRE